MRYFYIFSSTFFPIFLFLFILPASVQAVPEIVVQYHVWYDTPYGPESVIYPRSKREQDGILWGLWDTRRAEGDNRGSPDIIRQDGWTRNSTATPTSYPFIGLYDPDDPEILRWHIRLAKAAGIKALAVSAYSWTNTLIGQTEPSLESKRTIEIFRKMLEIATQEHFYLVWEYWWGGPTDWSLYRDIFNHPNYFRYDDSPLIWIAPNIAPYNYFGNNIQEFDNRARDIEAAIGLPLTWAISANHPNMDTIQSQNKVIASLPENINAGYSLTDWYQIVNFYHSLTPARPIAAHIYPGFNDTILTRRANTTYWGRNGGSTLTLALDEAKNANVDLILLESWNDFSESTAIEPGVKEDYFHGAYQQDPYKDLRIIASFTGIPFTPPELPPASSVDPHTKPNLYRIKPGDINGDGRVDIFDFNLLVSNFGNPYTIFDFSQIIANYQQ